jgi:hypothetical protein
MAGTYCLVMKDNGPLEERRETELPMGKQPSNGISTPEKVEAYFPEPEIQDEEAFGKGTENSALAQFRNALKFCVRGLRRERRRPPR